MVAVAAGRDRASVRPGRALRALVGLLAFVVPAYGTAAQTEGDVPSLAALRLEADESVALDGRLDEPLWARADVASGFLQEEPNEGAPATEPTEVRVVYDADDLYLGVMLFDSDPAGILGREMRRDAGLGADDRFMWILDTFLDGRTGYFFEINPAGLMGDGLIQTGGGHSVNKAWDGIWEARVTRGPDGWSAEIRIPFRTLNFDAGADTWAINFQRTIRRKNEELRWSGHRRTQGLTSPVHAGRLTGLRELSQGLGVEVTPYGLGAVAQAPAAGDSTYRTEGEIGGDIGYSISPSLRASVTVNTDFAEAEVDQRRVNLTRFPLFFPEQRDFFLEGSQVYAFTPNSGPNPFFSRRIGLVEGRPVPIEWGARLGGQAGPNDIGLLQIRTGAAADRPGEDFTVARVKRRILAESTVGVIYTRRASAAFGDRPDFLGQTFGVDLNLATSEFRGGDNLQFEAFFVGHDDPVDAGGTTLGDRSARGIRLNYPNDIVRAHVSFREFGDHYDPAVGFVSRRGFRRLQPTFAWRPRPDSESIRQLTFEAEFMHLTDLDGRLETQTLELTPLHVEFESGDRVSVGVGRTFESIERDFRIHPEVIIPAGDYTFVGWEASLTTASRRLFQLELEVGGGEFWDGTRTNLQLELGARPRPGVSVGAEWEHNRVRLAGGSFRTNLLRLEGGWQPSPWVALSTNVQYDDLSRVVGIFSRFRWTFRPGNDLFFVYTHNLRDPLPTELDPRDPGLETLERRAALKVNYTHRF